jgi:hypothetical protein
MKSIAANVRLKIPRRAACAVGKHGQRVKKCTADTFLSNGVTDY